MNVMKIGARSSPVPQYGSKAEALAASLRSAIARGELSPGDQLPPEAELLAHFKISRPTYREAIRVLETEGLLVVERGARGGTRVLEPRLEPIARQMGVYLQMNGLTLGEVMETMLHHEPAAVRHIAATRDLATVSVLRSIIFRQRELVPAEVAPRDQDEAAALLGMFMMLDGEFRDAIVIGSGNAVTRLLGRVLNDLLERHRVNAGPALDSRRWQMLGRGLERSVALKERVVEHIEAGRAALAEEEWRGYLVSNLRYVETSGLKATALLPICDPA